MAFDNPFHKHVFLKKTKTKKNISVHWLTANEHLITMCHQSTGNAPSVIQHLSNIFFTLHLGYMLFKNYTKQ